DMAFFFDSNICHQAMLIKTELLLRRPYDESMKIYGDWDEWIELYMQGAKFEYRDVIVCDFLFGGLSTDESSKTLKNKRKAEIELLHKRYYAEPWQSTMARVVPILHEYKALKSWQDEGGMTSNDRKFFSEKRKKHNKIIRVLIYVCCLLLTANIATILYILL
ncbi:MAG: hypothetical protein J1F27_08210, partial [Prevotellaceae bacterium]|nr:hypothetical protein [Prevotellaceae bacterium]